MTGVRLSVWDLNSSRPRILFPAVLFPAPDLPRRTSRSSGEEEEEEDWGNEEETEDEEEGDAYVDERVE